VAALTSTDPGDERFEVRAAGEGRSGGTIVFVALVVICLLTIFPLIWMVSSAFKPGEDVYSLSIIPESPTLDNFRYVFTELPFPRYMFNSFFVSATVTAIALFFHSMAAYALARLRFPGRELIFRLIFATLLVSLPVILVPLFVLVRAMGMLNSYAGLIIPAIFHAFGIFLLRQFYLGIPDELEEAAIRRRRLLAGLRQHHPAPEPADPGRAGRLLLSRQLELVPLAADDHQRPEPLGRADRNCQFSATVRLGPELHHGRLCRRRHADDAPLLHLPAPARGVDQDVGIQVVR
jgi:hypothetical protein